MSPDHCKKDIHRAFLGLGTNLGDKEGNLKRAVELIRERIGEVSALSALHASEPWGFESPNAFLNAVCRVETDLPPLALLDATQAIERLMGRTKKSVGGVYHDRIIDIDILMYDDLRLETSRLTLPHPLMQERDFVMVPLKEVLGE